MGFWDTVNQDLERIFHNRLPADGLGLPSLGELESSSDVPPIGADPIPVGDVTAPDQVKDQLEALGYTPPEISNPYRVDPAEQFASIVEAPSPFNVIDVTPSLDGGTRLAGQAGQQVTTNNVPANQSTLDAIGRMLGIPVFSLFANAGLLSNAARPGVTYQVAVAGSSLRIDKLPSGMAQFPAAGITITPNPQSSGVTSPLIPNDVYVQNALNLLLGGIFVQFDSPGNPVFLVKPGETYSVVFTRLFITTFGSAGRFRIIAGNKATVKGESDERMLRQNLHIWDGGGLLDNPMFHPVPFTCVVADPGAAINSNFPAFFCTFPLISGVQRGATVPPGGSPFSNFDDGSGLTLQGSGNVVGKVSNKGYRILWVTGINYYLTNNSSTNLVKLDPSSGLIKARNAPVNYTSNAAALVLKSGVLLDSAPGIQLSTNGSIGSFLEATPSFSTPKRVVLAGFDTYDPSVGGVQATGESLFLSLNCIFGGGSSPPSGSIVVTGYFLPGLVPFNPYPQDVLLPL